MRLLKIIVAAAAVALGLAPAAHADSTVDQIRARGVLRIPAILNEVPYFNKDPRTGEWHGFVIDMAQDVADQLGGIPFGAVRHRPVPVRLGRGQERAGVLVGRTQEYVFHIHGSESGT